MLRPLVDTLSERQAAIYVVSGWMGDECETQGPMQMADAAVAAMGLEHSCHTRVSIRNILTGRQTDLEAFLHEHPGIGGAA